jgi:enamine deaminase RidA (YjgF/YER057c/UK114 family)
MEILHPPGWARPKGYSNGIAATGRTIFVSGMIGWAAQGDAHSRLVASDIAGQVRQALKNILDVLAQAGAKPEHIVRMNWYFVDKHEYLSASGQIGEVYRELMGRHYPAMTALQVAALLEDGARIEIEATAVVP